MEKGVLFGMLCKYVIIWFGGQQIHILPEKKYTSKLSYTAFCREINVVWYSEFSADENSVIVSSLYGFFSHFYHSIIKALGKQNHLKS